MDVDQRPVSGTIKMPATKMTGKFCPREILRTSKTNKKQFHPFILK
jgi:hypothetical protein